MRKEGRRNLTSNSRPFVGRCVDAGACIRHISAQVGFLSFLRGQSSISELHHYPEYHRDLCWFPRFSYVGTRAKGSVSFTFARRGVGNDWYVDMLHSRSLLGTAGRSHRRSAPLRWAFLPLVKRRQMGLFYPVAVGTNQYVHQTSVVRRSACVEKSCRERPLLTISLMYLVYGIERAVSFLSFPCLSHTP